VSPVDSRAAQLAMEIDRDWTYVETHASRARSVDPVTGPPEAALVAVALDHAYEAFESILIRVERGLGLPERTGPDWHAEIVTDAGWPLPGIRPAVFPAEVRIDWHELRRYRHFFRHAYAVDLDPIKLCANIERLERAVAATAPCVRALAAALSAAPAREGGE
jgi:hypothetical protein